MFFTSRNKNTRTKRHPPSNSKSSDKSVSNNPLKNKLKPPDISKSELQLRVAISSKYSKSKIKHFKYQNLDDKLSNYSDNSLEMEQFSWLKLHKFINLKEFHTKLSRSEIIQKKYLIRIKNNDPKKSIKTQKNSDSSPYHYTAFHKKQRPLKTSNNMMDSLSFDKKGHSEEKRMHEWRKLGFEQRGISKKIRNVSVSPSEQETFYNRKGQKSRNRQVNSQINDK